MHPRCEPEQVVASIIAPCQKSGGALPLRRGKMVVDAEPNDQQDLRDRQPRQAEGDERLGVRPRARRRDAAPEYNSEDLELRCDRGGEWARRRHSRAERHSPQSCRHCAWGSRRHDARQLHGSRRSVNAGEGCPFDDARIQDFTSATNHAGNRSDQGRGRRLELRPSYRDSRRTDHRSPRALARPRNDDVFDLSELSVASRHRTSAPGPDADLPRLWRRVRFRGQSRDRPN
jgi:hypothetical protein